MKYAPIQFREQWPCLQRRIAGTDQGLPGIGRQKRANLTAAIHALSGVKTPAEFLTAQQKLLADGVEAVVADSQTIAKLTIAVFTAAFEPVKVQIEALQKIALKPAG
nr:phasin family protein [uncultured Rhodopila sp.]